MSNSAVPKPNNTAGLRAVVATGRVLIDFESLCRVLGRERQPTAPITVTKQKAAFLADLSPRTIDRMIARGRTGAAG